MTKSHIFFLFLLSFVGGIFARSFVQIHESLYFILLVSSIVVLGMDHKNKKALLVSFSICFFMLGALRTNIEIEKANKGGYVGKEIEANVTVEKVFSSSYGKKIVVKFKKEKILAQINVSVHEKYKYGDVLEVVCFMEAIENRQADFDYRMLMAKDGIYYQCKARNIEKVDEGKGNFIFSFAESIKNNLERNISRNIPHPEDELAKGLMFGGGDGLSRSMQEDFSRAGMTHILAVSGFNVTIIVEYLILLGIFLGLWRQQALLFAVAGIVLFIIMVGFLASALRAGLMGSILIWAMKHGRLAKAHGAVLFAAAIMLLVNPLLLRWDIGFQLSFLATIGIVTLSPLLENSIVKKHKAMGVVEIIFLTIAAQVFVVPVLLIQFGSISIVSIISNVAVLPFIPVSMLLVFLLSLAGFINFIPISMVISWLTFLVLKYITLIIHMLAELPWASMGMQINVLHLIGYYIILSLAVYFIYKNKSRQNLFSEQK